MVRVVYKVDRYRYKIDRFYFVEDIILTGYNYLHLITETNPRVKAKFFVSHCIAHIVE